MEKIKNVMVSVMLIFAFTSLILLVAYNSIPNEPEETPVAETTVVEINKVEP